VVNSDGVVKEVTGEIAQTEIPPELSAPIHAQSMPSSFRSRSPLPPQEMATEVALGSLADVFNQIERKPPKKAIPPAAETTVENQTLEAKTTAARKGEGPITEETRTALLAEMQSLSIFLERIRGAGNRVKLPKTEKDKALNTMLDRALALHREGNILSTEIAAAGESERESSLRGKISSLGASVKSLLKKNAEELFPSWYALGWFDSYKALSSAIPEAVRKHELAPDVVAEGLATYEEIARMVKAKLETKIPDLEKGKTVTIDEVINEALDDLTK
jgi:hypothetical protein